MGAGNEYSLDHHYWICSGGDRKVLTYPGNKYEPTGFILTTVLGIVGAFAAAIALTGDSGGIKLARTLVSLGQSLARS